ncbi:MAG: hypothetical protein Q8N96_06285 [Methylovulum sp.]|nr:hypothetical protein [Methylovulum sp.]
MAKYKGNDPEKGMVKALGNMLDFYDSRFQIGFDNRERLDLILFLRTL